MDSLYKFQYYHSTPRVIDEATQLHVMLPVEAQHELLDDQALITLTLRRMKRKIRRQPKSCWMQLLYGHYDRVMSELSMEDQASFFNF